MFLGVKSLCCDYVPQSDVLVMCYVPQSDVIMFLRVM